MSIQFAIGKGKHTESAVAAQQAAETCQAQLGSLSPDLLLLFCSSVYDQSMVLKTVNTIFPHIPLMGCSTAGEIYSSGPDEHSVALIALCHLHVQLAQGGDVSEDAFSAGRRLGEQLASSPSSAILVLSDGLAGDNGAVVRGMQAGLNQAVPYIGGAAADDNQFRKTFEYLGASVYSRMVVGATLAGDFHFGIGARHGWEPVGLPVRVTKSQGNRLLEINGLPALDFYSDYFGEYAERLKHAPLGRLAVYYPLGLAVPNSEEFLLRAPMTVDTDGAIKFTAEIPEGMEVRLMIGSVERAIQAARLAAMEALAQMQGHLPQLAILFNCSARRRLFGLRAHEEIKTVQDVLGANIPLVGFYTYGEIASLANAPSDTSSFLNETMVILTLG